MYLFLPCACTLMMLVSQDRYHIILWRNIFLLMVPLYIADITVVSIVELVRGNRKGLVLFIALLPMFIFGIFDILVFSLHIIEGGVPLYPIGVPFMVVIIGLQLVDRFINNLNAAEKLNVILEETMEDGKRLAALDNELSIARRIQLANVPRSLPELKSFSIGVKYIPAENISGDFYNFHSQEQDRLGVLIADVSGHGVPASLIASMVKILFSTLAPLASNPDLFIKGMNAYLRDKLEGHFLTAGYCFIDRAKRRAQYARAGHEPLVHLSRKNGDTAMREIGGRGRAIGLHDDIDMRPAEFEVAQGDRLVLFTDGLVEAFNDRKEIFGRERLKALILQSQDFPAERAAEYIYKALREWNCYNAFMDDLTLIIIDVE
ncbi:MAG TPA: PP2C family protein-serine/threonine phosphatase [Spirochaetota bacterium]|nr:PP2C family protein-serine/threonine phosphatase [Spirochaetota bacterium]